MKYLSLIFTFISTGLFVDAQTFSRKPPKLINSHLQVSAHSKIGVSATFKNIGIVNYYDFDYGANFEYEYYNGYVDFPTKKGSTDPLDTDDSTGNYQIILGSTDEPQKDVIVVEDDDSGLFYVDSVKLNNYRGEYSEGTSREADVDGSSSFGWEIAYQYDFKKTPEQKFVWGLIVATGFDSVTFSHSDYVEDADIYREYVTVDFDNDLFLYEEGKELNGSGSEKSEISKGDISEPQEERMSEIAGLTYADLDVNYDLDTTFFYLRFGPTFKWHAFKNISLQASVGAFVSYMNSDFSSVEILSEGTILTDGNIFEEVDESFSDVLFGAYAELQLQMRLNERTSFFITYEQEFNESVDDEVIGDVEVSLDIDTSQKIGAGFIIKY